MPQTPQSPQTFLADRPIVLHHYPQSPFAEKVRLIFGFKGLKWRSVTIPIIMPKPDLLALTGGYRKTPVLQLGRSIFCDTALIATVLDRLSSSSPLFPDGQRANASIIAAWADSIWFSACVAQAMQPAAFKSLFPGQSDEQLAAFAADRKAMRAGSPVPRMTLGSSTPIFMNQIVGWITSSVIPAARFCSVRWRQSPISRCITRFGLCNRRERSQPFWTRIRTCWPGCHASPRSVMANMKS